MIGNGSKQYLMCPLFKNDYKIREKICNDKIIVKKGQGGKWL